MARALVREGAEQAMADYLRYLGEVTPEMLEPTLKDAYPATLDAPDPELGARLGALHDLPEGTLGYEYVEFYRRNGLTLPGDDPNMPAMFVAHDMCHVIAGYEPTGQGEIALGGFQLAMNDTPAHWASFLGNLSVHEAGILTNESVTGKTATLTREHAPEMLAHAMWRGAQCTDDFTTIDHLALVEVPLTEVRDRFGVPQIDAPIRE
jgi:ubiquinone biosynthesis protein Coq4